MLEICELTKHYAGIPVVDNVSFTIAPGEVLGYLGPNGAGKSTTVRMLIGLIEPSGGGIYFNGRDVRVDLAAFQRRIGYVPEEATLYPHLTGCEYLQLAGRLRGMPHQLLEPRIHELLRLFGLWADRGAPIAAYSKGMRQKALLAAALLHNPELLILDEPLSGLDVNTALVLRALLGRFAEKGGMVLYSSHVMEAVDKICDRVVILRDGRVAAYDSVSRLRDLIQRPTLEGVFTSLTATGDPDDTARGILEVIDGEGARQSLA